MVKQLERELKQGGRKRRRLENMEGRLKVELEIREVLREAMDVVMVCEIGTEDAYRIGFTDFAEGVERWSLKIFI